MRGIDSVSSIVARAGEGLVDIVYPKRCAGCGFRGCWVCRACLEWQPLYAEPWCERCGVPEERSCRCAWVPDPIDRLRSVGPYDGWLRQAIHRMKYEGESARATHLASLMAERASEFSGAEALVAVPLHRNRRRERGFNQSELLAGNISAQLGMPIWDVLIRVRDTRHQTDLTADEREHNVRDAFDYRPDTSMRPSRVILVDDVLTTGSTLGACAAALKRAGVARIDALTVC